MIPVEEGRRLLAEATPAEWRIVGREKLDIPGWLCIASGTLVMVSADIEADAALIVFLRNHAGALLEAAERAEDAEANLEGVRLALAEADVPRSNGVDEPLYSEQYRVRLLRERADQLAEELRIREQSQIPVIPKAAQEYLETAEAALAEAAEQNQRLSDALRPFVENWDFHACDYLTDLVDGAEVRVIEASVVDDIIAAQKVARAALAGDAE